MNIKRIGRFNKHFTQRIKPNPGLAERFKERLDLFLASPQNPILKNHKLRGDKQDLRAFSVTGDIRVVYFITGEDLYLVDIGTHNQVY